MNIKTKYEIGQHIWYLDIHKDGGELFLFDTYIVGITIDKNDMYYTVDEQNYFEVNEEDIILYEDKDKLYEIIKIKMKEANEIMEKEK